MYVKGKDCQRHSQQWREGSCLLGSHSYTICFIMKMGKVFWFRHQECLSREQEEGVLSEHYDSGKDCDIVEDKWLSNCL